MEQSLVELFSIPRITESAEGSMLQEDLVREVLARLESGEKIKRGTQELGRERKAIKRWRRLGGWRPQGQQRAQQIEPFAEFIGRRGAEGGWNAVVLHRELCVFGFAGSYQQVRRFISPLRAARCRPRCALRPVLGSGARWISARKGESSWSRVELRCSTF